MLDKVVGEHRTRTAIVDQDRILSYEELGAEVAQLARRLHHLGIRKGDRLALFIPNGADFVIGYFAAAYVGAIIVPLNHGYQKSELQHFIEITGSSVLLTCRGLGALSKEVTSGLTKPCRLVVVEEREAAPSLSRVEVDPDSPAMYQFSSGSTGTPKRIARTHAQLITELDSLASALTLTAEDRFLGVAPFSHVNGLMRTMLSSIRAGAALYTLAEYERRAVAGAIEKHRLTVFIGIPFMFIMLVKSNFRTPPDLSSLRVCISASAAMPAKYNREFHSRFGFYVRQLYGSTETGSISVNLDPDIENSLDSIGRPLPGVEIRLVDDKGEPVAGASLAELAIRSSYAITSYDGLPDQSSFKDGYFLSGDLGTKESAGRFYLAGRKKFFINRGGYKIDPREVEELLESHPAVEEAIAVGLPTPFGDEKVKAVVVPRSACTEEELVLFCKGKIADFKIPSLVEFRDALPKTPTGKVLRRMLIESR
ncbi:MAG TPA: AMP-binding protein [Candidatus Binataceae bacterium]|nr:AMP-binding protein [Candidatus Binataceae bacterium]